MEKLERLAGQLAREFDHLTAPASDEELLQTASLVAEVADEFTAFQQGGASAPSVADPRLSPVVLVVEGEAADRGEIRRLLAGRGYSVLEAAHGAEALELCEGHPGSIHIMLTNVIVEDMIGRELAERVAALRPDMAIIYMSGYTNEEILFYGVLGPGVPALEKPIRPEELAEALESRLAVLG